MLLFAPRLQVMHPERGPAYVAPFDVEERQTVLGAFAAVVQAQRESGGRRRPGGLARASLGCGVPVAEHSAVWVAWPSSALLRLQAGARILPRFS